MSSTEWPPKPWPTDLHQYVQYLKDHLTKIDRWDSLEEAVHQARYVDEIIELEEWGISTADEFLQYASYLLTKWIPCETRDGKFLYHVITVFYYILDSAPMKDMQTPIERVSIQGDMPMLTPMSNWIVGYAKRIGDWLETPESITPESYDTFKKCAPYRMSDPCDYHLPEPGHPTDGFKTFNQFFYRHLKEPRSEQDKIRPCARTDPDPAKDNHICFPADSTFDSSCPINDKSRVVIKGVHWPVSALLAGSKYKDEFAGGQWAHAFLNTFNYHQQNIPVDGVVEEAYNVEGCAYLQVEAKQDDTGRGRGRKRLEPRRPWTAKAGGKKDMFAATPDAPDDAGYQFIQLRGNIIIRADNPSKFEASPTLLQP